MGRKNNYPICENNFYLKVSFITFMSLEKLKVQILSDLPNFGILRPEMEKFNQMFNFWFSSPIEKKFCQNLDGLDILLRAYAIGYFYGQSGSQLENSKGENKMLRRLNFPTFPEVWKSIDQMMTSISDDFTSLLESSEPFSNWKQTETGYELRLEVPGFSKEDLTLEVDQETATLMIEGKKKDQNSRHVSQSSFRVSRTMPFNAKLGSVTASVQNGVCLVSVQSEELNKPRTISVPIS